MAGLSNFTFNSYANKNAWLFSGSRTSSYSTGFNFGDYYMIKNGTYKKLLKSYYALDKSDKSNKTDSTDSTKKDTPKLSTLIRDNARALETSAEKLKNSALWEQKDITKKDEKTGEETTTRDYDWDSITKAVKGFVEDYNSTLDKAAESDNNTVLRNATFMTGTTRSMGKLLEEVGITIGEDNKLELDEEKLKKSRITTLKTLFRGSNSYADRMSQRASTIVLASGRDKTGSSYTRSGAYSDTISRLVDGKINEEV